MAYWDKCEYWPENGREYLFGVEAQLCAHPIKNVAISTSFLWRFDGHAVRVLLRGTHDEKGMPFMFWIATWDRAEQEFENDLIHLKQIDSIRLIRDRVAFVHESLARDGWFVTSHNI